jgi:hypothetical protein
MLLFEGTFMILRKPMLLTIYSATIFTSKGQISNLLATEFAMSHYFLPEYF